MDDTIDMADTLYYDGNCPLCSYEIRILNRYKDNKLHLIDIHSQDNRQQSKNKLELLLVLHLQTKEGQWLTGLDATVAAWQHTRVGFAFKPLRWPLIKPVSDYVYKKWAVNRQCKLTT